MFELNRSIEILERTPTVLRTMLEGISEGWYSRNEGENTWSPYDVIGHLIHGERTDWIPRLNIIFAESGNKIFAPFDRFAQFEESRGKTLQNLLDEFDELRNQNLQVVRSKNIKESDLTRTAMHPALGEVNLRNLLATWTAHDLNHIGQIVRVMAKQYKEDVGPWAAYLRVMQG